MKQWKDLKVNELTENKLHYYLTPADSSAPRFYGKLKIRKPGVAISPTVSFSDSSLYNLNKYIAKTPKAYVKEKNNNANNFTKFSNLITNVNIEDDEIMVSFDITSF